MPAPVSFTMTGSLISPTISHILSRTPLNLVCPSGWTVSCKAFKCTATASASIISMACFTSFTPHPWTSCIPPMLAIKNAVGAFFLATEKVLASFGFSMAARWLPTPIPKCRFSTASAIAALICFASVVPPVIAPIINGAENL